MKRGEYKIIRVDGTEELIQRRPSLRVICGQIACDNIDTVRIGRNPVNGEPETIMVVDDTGMVDGKPINPKATALYHSVCKPNTPFSIHGDVAICNDGDFA